MSAKDSVPTEPITIVGGSPKRFSTPHKLLHASGLLNPGKALNFQG
jgi:hypothetical protein